jgi:cation diffusion facilitator family transporter
VAVLVGILGARLAFWYLDPIAGLAVSALIVKMSITLLRPNIGILMDERPDTAILNEITAIAQKVLGVRTVDSLRVHRRGSTFTIDIEIAVDSGLTVEQGHQVASEVKRTLLSKVQHTQDVVVHVNPYRPMQVCDKEVRHAGGR